MEESQAINGLGALAHPLRLQIVRYLVTRGTQGASAGQIAEATSAQPSRLSFHTAILEQAGLVTSERRSRNIIYQLSFAQMGEIIAYLLQDCSSSHPEVASCCALAKPDVSSC